MAKRSDNTKKRMEIIASLPETHRRAYLRIHELIYELEELTEKTPGVNSVHVVAKTLHMALHAGNVPELRKACDQWVNSLIGVHPSANGDPNCN